jgi:hypothetical protein
MRHVGAYGARRAARPGIVHRFCDKRDDINRVSVSADRVMQWRSDAVCGFIAASLGLRRSDQHPADAGLLNIGMASGDKRSQMLSLRGDGELALVAAKNAVPLAELNIRLTVT